MLTCAKVLEDSLPIAIKYISADLNFDNHVFFAIEIKGMSVEGSV